MLATAAAPATALRTRDDLRRLLRLSDMLGWLRAVEASAPLGSPASTHLAELGSRLESQIDALAGTPVRHVGERGLRCRGELRIRADR